MGADEGELSNNFSSQKVLSKYKDQKNEVLMEESKKNRVIGGA